MGIEVPFPTPSEVVDRNSKGRYKIGRIVETWTGVEKHKELTTLRITAS